MSEFSYLRGFGNEFESESIPGALPRGRNNPQKVAMGLYAEQLSGSAFTAPRKENRRSWLYKIMPSARHSPFASASHPTIGKDWQLQEHLTPNQLRWNAPAIPSSSANIIDSLIPICNSSSADSQTGSTIWLYATKQSMGDECFCNYDGEMIFVPQQGQLRFQTEFGWLEVETGEIAVIGRGIKFRVDVESSGARGYVCENFGASFELPYRGPIGANGLANERDFMYPQASYEEKRTSYKMLVKFCSQLYSCQQQHSPFDVVAWHGNYAPYKYDLRLFNTMNTVSYDHPDPSIFTVLTSASARPGTANVDFVIFPSRWMVAEDTFRPPYYHRNVMSEYMGLIYGVYDAKPAGGGFEPGGGSLHNCMAAHGPDASAFAAASEEQLKPAYQKDTLAFMFESSLVYKPTVYAMDAVLLQKDYWKCWQNLEKHFSPPSA